MSSEAAARVATRNSHCPGWDFSAVAARLTHPGRALSSSLAARVPEFSRPIHRDRRRDATRDMRSGLRFAASAHRNAFIFGHEGAEVAAEPCGDVPQPGRGTPWRTSALFHEPGADGTTPIMTAPLVVALFFLAMGFVALLAPERVTATFGQATLTGDGRNEVRAVYGGFGVATAVVLAVATYDPALRTGVFTAVAAALAGMAGGRLVAVAFERPRTFYPVWFYFAAEVAMAAVLVVASR
jgi:hypothetical protein